MRKEAIDRLTDRQRQCLRLLYAHHKAGEIATELGISTDRVNQHLKAARERLGVTRSIHAAKMLAAAEAPPSPIVGDHELGVFSGHSINQFEPSSDDEIVREPLLALAEAHVQYQDQATDEARDLWPLPGEGRRINRLTWYQKVAWAILVALGATVLAGAMVSLQNAIR